MNPLKGRSSFDLLFVGWESTPISETKSRVKFWIFDKKENRVEVNLPNWTIVPMTSLAGIWLFPGEFAVNIADGFTRFSHYVNSGLSYLLGAPQNLSAQVVYSGAAVGGYFFYRLVNKIAKRFGLVADVAHEMAAQVGIPRVENPPPPKAPMKPITAQYLAVMKMLIDVSRSNQSLGARNLMHWGTNYNTEDHSLAFDLMLVEQNGEPVLVVINREI